MPRPRKPLSLAVLHIMLVLADGPHHGYAIKQAVEGRTDGTLRLGPGTLYEAIQRLEEDGLIEALPRRAAEAANGQEAQRRYYRLTDRGWKTLQDEVRQLDTLVSAAKANPKLRKGLA
jgi:DNA-binding PadR family transcriptional regulator